MKGEWPMDLSDWGEVATGCGVIAGGIYGYLVVYGVIKPKSGQEKKMELWHKKYDGLLKVTCPIMIICGLFLVLFDSVKG